MKMDIRNKIEKLNVIDSMPASFPTGIFQEFCYIFLSDDISSPHKHNFLLSANADGREIPERFAVM